jgi:ribosome-associated protein YbcJ (S4-like RNA binding protein)
MNIRKLVVKGLYPLCSSEVQILLDQMQNKPDKFSEIFDDVPYRTRHPWARALSRDNFELLDHIALRQQLKLMKTAYAKQLILEGLLEVNESEDNRNGIRMFDSLVDSVSLGQARKASAPTKIAMSQVQLKAAMAVMEKETAKRAVKARK